MHPLKLLGFLFLAASLVACGGSGGSSSPAPSSAFSSTPSLPSSTSSSGSESSSQSSASSESTSSSSASTSSSSSSSIASSSSSSSVLTSSSSSSSALSSSTSSTSSSSAQSSSSSTQSAQITSLIVVDQFGYLPNAQKIAVLRNPQTGFDAALSYTPGPSIQLVNADSGAVVHSAAAQSWNSGATAPIAGDRVWWFDFSSVTTPGRYLVLDPTNNLRSPAFSIGNEVYKPVLYHAFRTFFYQRAGFAKQLPYAQSGWTDGASHLGPNQDPGARLYTATGDAGTARDLRGGWYDAGDFNKYTNWHADYLIVMLHTYLENPAAWGDDFDIPESGNGRSDLIDEIIWGMDWLVRMQEPNGSVLSIMGLAHASPPSAATAASTYGPASTSATLTSAAAFAFGAKVLASLGDESLDDYIADLRARAESAWTWANANPNVTFYNSGLVGAGEQETNNEGRANKKLAAAIYLFAEAGNEAYKTFVDNNVPAIDWVSPWNEPLLSHLLYYASLPEATTSVATSLRTGYANAMNSNENWQPARNAGDPYRAFIGQGNFTWGSNRTMARKGTTFYNLLAYNFAGTNSQEVRNTALGYLNYLHGTNPLGMVYLSNMYSLGVHSSVNEFYHSWFADGSPQWDRVGTSTFGPAPGFLVGGPNPGYNWDNCCPGSCGSTQNNNICTSINLVPPKEQPAMKSYLDFNTSWPLNSWAVTENHNDYQLAYLRLLSKFVQ